MAAVPMMLIFLLGLGNADAAHFLAGEQKPLDVNLYQGNSVSLRRKSSQGGSVGILQTGAVVSISAFRTAKFTNDMRYCYDTGTSRGVVCNERQIMGDSGKFTVNANDDGTFSLKSGRDNKWCTFRGNNVNCIYTQIGTYEKFVISDYPGEKHVSPNSFYANISSINRNAAPYCTGDDGVFNCRKNQPDNTKRFTFDCLSGCTTHEYETLAPTPAPPTVPPTASPTAPPTAPPTLPPTASPTAPPNVPQCTNCGPRPMECWETCGQTKGYCSACDSASGTRGACCYKGGNPSEPAPPAEDKDPEECDTVDPDQFLHTGYHVCVLLP